MASLGKTDRLPASFSRSDVHIQEQRVVHARAEYPATSKRRVEIRRFIKHCAAHYPLPEPILDIGAGYRSNESELWNGEYLEYYTLDIDPSLGSDLVADAANMSMILPGTVGTCVCTELLEHVENPRDVVSEVHRILKPSGLFIVTVPFCVPIHEKPQYRDYWRFTPSAMRLLLAEFALLELQTTEAKEAPEGVFAVARKLTTTSCGPE